jgi:hypothetical protein
VSRSCLFSIFQVAIYGSLGLFITILPFKKREVSNIKFSLFNSIKQGICAIFANFFYCGDNNDN